ncbi:MAG: sugar ABC transporter permease [Fusobacteriaceae bacterium]|nr:sugar ABC transporter permease [Fusobacteriaceae bacterium]
MKTKKNELIAYVYLFPAALFFILFTFYPFLKTIIISLTRTNIKGEIKRFVGFLNYSEIFSSPSFINMIFVTFKYVVIVVLFSTTIGFGLALLVNNKLKINKIFRVIYTMPMSISSAVASMIWMLMYHPSIGILNKIFSTQIGWLINPKIALLSVSIVTIWVNVGINFIFFYSGLKNIPIQLIESSEIDGAKYRHKLWNIIIPLMSPTIFFMCIINTINAFQSFGQINILTGGGPGESTTVFVFSIYREAFFNGRFDLACTQSIVLFLIMLIVTMIQFKSESKGVFYQ